VTTEGTSSYSDEGSKSTWFAHPGVCTMSSGSPSHPERHNQSQHVSNSRQSPKLAIQVLKKMRSLHYSIRTESAYVDWSVRFLVQHQRGCAGWETRNAEHLQKVIISVW
jgi:hypothetical protein